MARPTPPREPAPTPNVARDSVPRFSPDHMDRAADPKREFYRFASGGWIARNPVPADKSRWSGFDELRERNLRLLREIGESSARSARRSTVPATPTAAQLVGRFYAAAMDRATRDRKARAPIAKDLEQLRKVRSVDGLIQLLADWHSRGIPGFFTTIVGPDEKQSEIYALYLYQGGLSLPDRDYYLTETFAAIRAGFLRHVTRSLELLGVPTAQATSEAATILKIETEVARASRTRTELRDSNKNYNRFALEELRKRYPTLRWAEYVRARGAKRPDHVVVGQPEFFDALARWIREVPLAEWKMYLRWQLLRSAAPHLDHELDDEHFNFFRKQLLGQPEPEPDWKRATAMVDDAIGEALGRLYVRRHFTPEARARMEQLVEDLRAVFRDRLESIPWMSEATRALARKKFERFRVKIGHPKRFRDYAKLRISATDHLGNVQRAAAFEERRGIARIGKPVDREEWLMTPPTVNAYFDPTKNEIVFPAGILQPPFFDPTLDDAVNYGGIGVVIGHEITHGYDDEGRKYNADGNLKEWWTDADAKEFQDRAKRIVDQFSRFEPIPGMRVNGALTAGENIADLGGVSVAYEALQRRLKSGRSAKTPIDGFTPEQRFFLSFGQIWRMNVREAEARRLLTIDPHSPGRYRVEGPLANLSEFWEAFGVPSGTPMRQSEDDRVVIW
ncbi:MAG: M13 family metallopeptidase [Thermoplasmata archaeon]